MSKECENCGNKIGIHGCEWCNEESYIVDQYYELEMELPDEDTEFIKKFRQQQKINKMDITIGTLQELINKRAKAKAKSEIDTLIRAIQVSGLTYIDKIYVNEDGKKRDLKYCLTDTSFNTEDNVLTILYNRKVKQYIVSETKDFVDKVERLVDETDNLLNISENF